MTRVRSFAFYSILSIGYAPKTPTKSLCDPILRCCPGADALMHRTPEALTSLTQSLTPVFLHIRCRLLSRIHAHSGRLLLILQVVGLA